MTTLVPMQTISTREFARNMKEYARRAKRGESFTVASRNEPEFVVSPAPKKKKYTLDDLLSLRFSGPKHASKNYKTILYGKKKAR